MAKIHIFLKWISGVSVVRIPTPTYKNVCPYQLSYAHGDKEIIWYINDISNIISIAHKEVSTNTCYIFKYEKHM